MQPLYKHQLEALDKFAVKDDIALFFEQGTGKTRTSLALAEYKFQQGLIDSLLVIAPNDVHKQWAKQEVPTWLSVPYDCVCFGGRGGVKQFYPPEEQAGKLGVVTVNIDIFSLPDKWKPVVEWANSHKTMIVLDEATCIKNVDSKRTQRILTEFNKVERLGRRMLRSTKICPCRCVLTGTPVTNGPMDLWSIMEFIRPNYFGRNWWDFKNYYGMYTKLTVNGRDIAILLNENTWNGIKRCSTYEEAWNIFGCTQDTYLEIQHQASYKGPYKHADELRLLLQDSAMFKKITECLDMPDKNYITKHLEMNPAQTKAYKEMVSMQATVYKDHMATALNKLTMATRLQQISSGFIYDKGYGNATEEEIEAQDLIPTDVVWLGDSNPKLEALMRDVAESDKPLIILTRYSAEAAKIYSMLKDDYNTMLYTGWKKTGLIEDYQQGKYEILVANTVCVARGFNLQNSHTILYYSNTFSMELREQSEARIFRSGQKNICKYVDYAFDGTVDETISKALANKKDMLEFFREHPEETIIF